MKNHQPEIFSKAHKFISLKEYVLFKLTGEYVVDESIASATGLFDVSQRQWASQALSITTLTAARLSRVVPVQGTLQLLESMAKKLGLRLGVPLVVGASDGCLAQLGSHAMGDDALAITIGTSGAVRVASSKRVVDPNGRIFNYILDDRMFVCGGATNNGTALLNWYAQQLDSAATEDPAGFVKQVSHIPAGCEGLVMIPHILGERAPIYDPHARGIFAGISVQHTKLHFQRALIEGICFQIRWIAEAVEDVAGKREEYYVSGGFTRSADWVQMLSDVVGRPLRLHEVTDASAMGAAILGFSALGIRCKTDETPSQVFSPDEKTAAAYQHSYERFRRIYAAVEGIN
jgi:gluconokinase